MTLRESSFGKKSGAAKKGGSSLIGHDFAISLRQLVPLMLVALAAFAVAMPLSTAAVPDYSVFNVNYTHDQLKFRFWLDDLNVVVVLGAAVYGVAVGIRAFRFLLVKCESTAVLSLPLSRSTLFATRFAACVATLIVGIGVPMTASLIVNVAALNVWTGLFDQFFFVLFGLILTGAISCALAVIACALAGTVSEAVTFAIALLTGVSVGSWGLNAIMDKLLVGNAFGEHLYNTTTEVASSLLDAWSSFNPLLFFLQQAQDHQCFIVQHPVYYPIAGDAALLGYWLIALAVLVVFALVLVRRRKGERAGIAGLNPALTFVVGIVVGLAAFGGTFTLLSGMNVAVASVASFAVFLIVSVILLKGPLKSSVRFRRTTAILCGETVALACVLVVVGAGGLGYAQAVPEVEDVSSVEVSYVGSPGYVPSKMLSATAGEGAYYFSASRSFSDEEAIAAVRAVHEQLALTGADAFAENIKDFTASVVPYDVVIRYTLANGGEIVRYYDRATYAELYQLMELDDAVESRELARSVVSGDVSLLDADGISALGSSSARLAYSQGDIYVSDRLYASPVLVNCDAQARTELLAALAQDVANQTIEDRYHPSGVCRGVVMFTQVGDADAETFAYSIGNTVVYLTDEFTQTLSWFKEKGLDSYLGMGANATSDTALAGETALVESMTFQRYAPYEAMNSVSAPQSLYFMGYRASTDQQFVAMQDFGTKFTTDDESQIAELLPLCCNACSMDAGGYLVSIKFVGQESYAYLFIPSDEAPEWLIRVAG